LLTQKLFLNQEINICIDAEQETHQKMR